MKRKESRPLNKKNKRLVQTNMFQHSGGIMRDCQEREAPIIVFNSTSLFLNSHLSKSATIDWGHVGLRTLDWCEWWEPETSSPDWAMAHSSTMTISFDPTLGSFVVGWVMKRLQTQQICTFEFTLCCFLHPFFPLLPIAWASTYHHVAHRAGWNGRIRIFSLGLMPIGSCRGKPASTHTMNSIGWPEALDLYEGKSTIFCESAVALAPDLLIVQTIKTTKSFSSLGRW